MPCKVHRYNQMMVICVSPSTSHGYPLSWDYGFNGLAHTNKVMYTVGHTA